MKKIIDQRFGRLVVIRDSGKRSNGAIYWECKCDCGNIHLAIGSNLKRGTVRSCGCFAKEESAKRCKNFLLVPRDCIVTGCLKDVKKGGWGYCGMHYMRLKRHGTIENLPQPEKRRMKKRFAEMQRRPAKNTTYHKFYGRHEHRIIGEEIAGRKLTSLEHVHHKDENRHRNSKDNLEVMTAAEHARHHHTKHES